MATGERRARWALTNLAIAYPNGSGTQLRTLARRSYAHLAWNLLDLLRMDRWSASDIRARMNLEGLDTLRKALSQGRGAILVVPHMGKFELGLQRLAVEGIPCCVVVRIPRNRSLARELMRIRTHHGVEPIERKGAFRSMLHAVRSGRTVVITLDQYAGRSGRVFVPLFGLRTATSGVAALLALRTGAPVPPAYVLREASDRHRGVVLNLVETVRTRSVHTTISTLTSRYMAILEGLILRHPEHWMWTYRRFRHSPDLLGDPYASGAASVRVRSGPIDYPGGTRRKRIQSARRTPSPVLSSCRKPAGKHPPRAEPLPTQDVESPE